MPSPQWTAAFAAAAVGLGAVRAAERLVLVGLDARPDPDARMDFAFPAERTRNLPTPDGGHLHLEELGHGPPVLLLHGHGASLGTFVLLAGPLAASGHRVIAADLRGFGQSSAVPDSFGFRDLIDDVAVVLEALDLSSVIVVGHSMGAAVALGLAAYRPDVVAQRVRGLVLLNGTARGPRDTWRNRAQVVALDWAGLERLGQHPRHGIVLSRVNFGTAPVRSHVEAARLIGMQSPIAARRGFARRLLGTDLTVDLTHVHVPVLALAGSVDRVVSARESFWLAEHLPDARVHMIQGAGHMLPIERAEDVAGWILEFSRAIESAEQPPD